MYDKNMWVVHYTGRENFETIKKGGCIKSAWDLMNGAEKKSSATQKREECKPLASGAVLRDQKPLTNRIKFSDDMRFHEYVQYLNQHVFFWPTRYVGNNRRHSFLHKYPGECEIWFQLCDSEKENKVLFSRYNSGATPRSPKQHKRSRNMFRPIQCRTAKESIVEIVFERSVKLPYNTKYRKK